MPRSRRPVVVVIEPIHPHYLKRLQQSCEVRTPASPAEQDLLACVPDADALIIRTNGRITPQVLAAAPRLKVIGRNGVGIDHIDVEAATRAGVWVVNTPAGSLDAVAEHTWMMILSLAKHAAPGDQAVRAGDFKFRNRFELLQLPGKTLGVFGLGRIGGRVAEIGALGFKMKILYTDLLKYPRKERLLKARKVSLDRLLRQSDVLTLHLPLTPLTRGILGPAQLARMKPAALLINCARGALLDAQALAEALSRGRLAGAGLDVFDPEEPSPDHPLLRCEKTLFSPHNAAQTAEARFNYAAVVLDVLRVLKGQRPLFPVNSPRPAPRPPGRPRPATRP